MALCKIFVGVIDRVEINVDELEYCVRYLRSTDTDNVFTSQLVAETSTVYRNDIYVLMDPIQNVSKRATKFTFRAHDLEAARKMLLAEHL